MKRASAPRARGAGVDRAALKKLSARASARLAAPAAIQIKAPGRPSPEQRARLALIARQLHRGEWLMNMSDAQLAAQCIQFYLVHAPRGPGRPAAPDTDFFALAALGLMAAERITQKRAVAEVIGKGSARDHERVARAVRRRRGQKRL